MIKKRIRIAFYIFLAITLSFSHSPLLALGQTTEPANPSEEQTSAPTRIKYQLRTSDHKGEYYFYHKNMEPSIAGI